MCDFISFSRDSCVPEATSVQLIKIRTNASRLTVTLLIRSPIVDENALLDGALKTVVFGIRLINFIYIF